MTQIMLASQSPRRKALLEQVGISFLVQSAQIDEVKLKITENEKYTL